MDSNKLGVFIDTVVSVVLTVFAFKYSIGLGIAVLLYAVACIYSVHFKQQQEQTYVVRLIYKDDEDGILEKSLH